MQQTSAAVDQPVDDVLNPIYQQSDNAFANASSPFQPASSQFHGINHYSPGSDQATTYDKQPVQSCSSAHSHTKGVPEDYTSCFQKDTLEPPQTKKTRRQFNEQERQSYRENRRNGSCSKCRASKSKVGPMLSRINVKLANSRSAIRAIVLHDFSADAHPVLMPLPDATKQ